MSYASEVLADSPAGYYRCQEASGLLQDSSGNDRHTTVSGGACTYHQTSPITSDPSDFSILFNSSWFTAPDSGFDFGDVWTMEMWIKRTTINQFRYLLSKGTGAYGLYLPVSNEVETDKEDVVQLRESSITIADTTTWHHIVATKNGDSNFIYIDAADVTVFLADATTVDNAIALFIGAYYGDAVTFASTSYMDEIAVYPTALSHARVSAHFAAATSVTPSTSNLAPVIYGRGAC